MRWCLGVITAVVALWAAPPPRYDLLVQGAVDGELQPLLQALQNKRESTIGAWTFWTGRIGKKSVVVSRTEMGPINAVAATVLGIEAFHPAAIINQGTAGAHNPDLNVWDIVLSERLTDYSAYKSVHADAGAGIDPARWERFPYRMHLTPRELTILETFPADAALLSAARRVSYARGRVVTGTVGSAYQFNREIDFIRWAHKTFGTDSEDMESAYVAGAALGMKTPFLAIRIISDSEFTHPTFEKIAGKYCAEFVVDFIRSLP